ncbi:nuclear transport factor 2 family protein [Arcobacter sp. LA11]|uniref:nuclear transport factor 2 family protein n=1 Tax=Arcobacter sp. LA11 TaxID=1898176 RepID=UPI000932496A|nr:nuclear transport factor 2 family protein [Arcobacter sp. LA11]
MRAVNYASFFENISSDTHIEEYKKIFDKDVRFKDPFHEVQGVEKIYSIFEDMYLKLDDPRFKVREIVEQKDIVYIRWDFIFSFKNSDKEESFEGVSRIEFNQNDKVISHTDYWDSSSNLYEKIPIVSSFIKFIKSRIKS